MNKITQMTAPLLVGLFLMLGYMTANATVMIIDDCRGTGQNWVSDGGDVADLCSARTTVDFISTFTNYSTAGLADDAQPGGAYGGDHSYVIGDSSGNQQVAVWVFSGLSAGTYDIWATWVDASNRADDAQYRVFDGSAINLLGIVEFNQQVAPSELITDFGITEEWEPFSSSYTIASDTLIVALYGQAVIESQGYVIADAIRIASVPEPGTLFLLGVGLLALVFLRRRKVLHG